MRSLDAHRALLLNADCRPVSMLPLSTVGWKKAVSLALAGDVTVLEEYDTVVRSSGSQARAPIEMQLPSILMLREFQRQDRPVAFTRLGLLVRDRFRCCYCGQRFRSDELTFEHIRPQSKGGKTNWLNIAASCSRDNSRRGNKPLEEVGMKLLWQPFAPTRVQLNEIARKEINDLAGAPDESCSPLSVRSLPRPWLDYLGLDAAKLDALTRVTRGPTSEAVFPADMTSEAYWTEEIDTD